MFLLFSQKSHRDGTEYVNERATATQQTGFWLVAQANRAAGDDMGILWFGVDDAALVFPAYPGMQSGLVHLQIL